MSTFSLPATRSYLASLALLVLGSLLGSSCTPNWLKISDQADLLFERGDLASAAEAYLEAYGEKPSRPELAYKAGEAYDRLRDYQAAANAYGLVADEVDDFPLVGLKYGRSLKQTGQYNEAIQALQEYLEDYPDDNRRTIEDVVYREIEGARLGLRANLPDDPNLTFGPLGPVVNSDGQEYAPLSFPNDVLYYTSTVGGRAQLYRTQREGETWIRPAVPETFPRIQGEAFGHGSLAPDGSRFYFTICEESSYYDPATHPCNIFMLRRVSGVWSQPERLSEVVNQTGASATQPFVLHRDGKEWLFFASNRSGGAGGMDIWYTSRNLTNEGTFDSPANLGPSVNTMGDDMTPFYDPDEEVLYFASDGHISMGGQDLYRARGFAGNFGEAEHLGLPYNSPADDYYLALKSDGSGAFWASNRQQRGKSSTLHDDLMELTSRVAPITVSASVFDGRSNQLIDNFSVRVAELDAQGNEQPLINQPFTGGTYDIDLVPGTTYRIEVMSNGYDPYTYEVTMEDSPNAAYGRPVYLNPAVAGGGAAGTTGAGANPASGNRLIDAGGTRYSGTGVRDNAAYTSTAPRYEGTYYRVQLIATRNFDPSRYRRVETYGEVVTETLPGRNLQRVLVGPYFSQSDARAAVAGLRNQGFDSAYIVEYQDGMRYGRVNF